MNTMKTVPLHTPSDQYDIKHLGMITELLAKTPKGSTLYNDLIRQMEIAVKRLR